MLYLLLFSLFALLLVLKRSEFQTDKTILDLNSDTLKTHFVYIWTLDASGNQYILSTAKSGNYRKFNFRKRETQINPQNKHFIQFQVVKVENKYYLKDINGFYIHVDKSKPFQNTVSSERTTFFNNTLPSAPLQISFDKDTAIGKRYNLYDKKVFLEKSVQIKSKKE